MNTRPIDHEASDRIDLKFDISLEPGQVQTIVCAPQRPAKITHFSIEGHPAVSELVATRIERLQVAMSDQLAVDGVAVVDFIDARNIVLPSIHPGVHITMKVRNTSTSKVQFKLRCEGYEEA